MKGGIIPNCLSCNIPMQPNGESGLLKGKNTQYKRCKYKCNHCGYEETVSAGRDIDILQNPVQIEKKKEEVKEDVRHDPWRFIPHYGEDTYNKAA